MRQRTIAEYITAIRHYIASKSNTRVVANAELTRSEKGFTIYESAIVLILFLIFLDSVVLGGAVLAVFYSVKIFWENCPLNLALLGALSIFISALLFVTFYGLFRRMMEKNDKHIEMFQGKYKQLSDSMNYDELRQALLDFKSQKRLF